MDARIDLTENRDFRKPSGFVSSVFAVLTKYPWHETERWYSANLSSWDELVPTGDKRERLSKKIETSFCDGITCDCCGAKIKPWERYYFLCSKCDNNHEEESVKITDFPLTVLFKQKLSNNKRKLNNLFIVDYDAIQSGLEEL